MDNLNPMKHKWTFAAYLLLVLIASCLFTVARSYRAPDLIDPCAVYAPMMPPKTEAGIIDTSPSEHTTTTTNSITRTTSTQPIANQLPVVLFALTLLPLAPSKQHLRHHTNNRSSKQETGTSPTPTPKQITPTTPATTKSDILRVDYGFRYYDPQTGRWPNRDPIEELGFNLKKINNSLIEDSYDRQYKKVLYHLSDLSDKYKLQGDYEALRLIKELISNLKKVLHDQADRNDSHKTNGFLNPYNFTENNPIAQIDYFGLTTTFGYCIYACTVHPFAGLICFRQENNCTNGGYCPPFFYHIGPPIGSPYRFLHFIAVPCECIFA